MAACADSCITSPSFAGDRQLAAAFHDRGFRGQDRSADFGPGQTHGRADFVLLLRLLFAKLLRAEQFVDLGRGDRRLLAMLLSSWRVGLRIDHRARHLAADVADFAFEVADAGFAGVVLDQVLECLPR